MEPLDEQATTLALKQMERLEKDGAKNTDTIV